MNIGMPPETIGCDAINGWRERISFARSERSSGRVSSAVRLSVRLSPPIGGRGPDARNAGKLGSPLLVVFPEKSAGAK